MKAAQAVGLRLGFHAFSHHTQAQRMGHGHDGGDDLAVVALVHHAVDEAAVDLELGQRQLAQARE